MKCSEYNLPTCWMCEDLNNMFIEAENEKPCWMEVSYDRIGEIFDANQLIDLLKSNKNQNYFDRLCLIIKTHYPKHINTLDTFLLLK